MANNTEEVKIIVQCSHMKVDVKNLSPAMRAKVTTLMTTTFSAHNSDLKNTTMGRRGLISLNVCAWDIETGFILTGFLPHIKAMFESNEIAYNVVDLRKWPKIDVDFIKKLTTGQIEYIGVNEEEGKKFKPRNYQVDAVINVVRNSTRKSQGGLSICNIPTGCLAGDSVINFNRGKVGRKQTIEKLYYAFNGLHKNRHHNFDRTKPLYVRSFNGTTIQLNEVESVSYSGIKELWLLKLENGCEIKATPDHRIMTRNGWVPMCELTTSDEIMCDTLHTEDFGQGIPKWSRVIDIAYYGQGPTYDIGCFKNHNFVANGMIVHNSGKSFVIALLLRCFPTTRILLPFQNVDLIWQTKKDLVNKYGFMPNEFGVIQAQTVEEDKRITLLSVPSYEKAVSVFPFVGVILQDEVHDAGSSYGTEMTNRVLYSCQNATIRIGLTATGDVIDNPYKQLILYGNFGPIVFKETMKDKVEDGTLADINIQIYDVCHDAISVLGSWADVYKKEVIPPEDIKKYDKKNIIWDKTTNEYLLKTMIALGDESTHYVYNDFRNKAIAKLAIRSSRCVVLLTRKAHSQQIIKFFKQMNFTEYMVVDGSKDNEEREEAKKFLLEHPNGVVVASSVWNKGVDVPWMENLIIAGSGVSTTATIQKLGRNARKCTDTEKFTGTIYDFRDMFSRLGIKQSGKRIHVYEKTLGFKITYLGDISK